MDPSISDILASVTRAHHATNGTSDPDEANQDLQLLTRAWIAERVAPELLPYPTDMMDRVTRRIRGQIETIEDRTARMDAGTSFALVVIQTELERFKFLVRSFLRARIAKIDAYPLHTLARHNNSLQSASPNPLLLSSQEAHYAQTYSALLHAHYTSSFLSSFPAKLQRFDDKAGAGGVGMIEGPDLDKAVFVRCLGIPPPVAGARRNGSNGGWRPEDEDEDEDEESRSRRDKEDTSFGIVEVSCGYTDAEGQDITMGDAATEESRRRGGGEKIIGMRRGDIWIVRWSSVSDAVAKGWCELI